MYRFISSCVGKLLFDLSKDSELVCNHIRMYRFLTIGLFIATVSGASISNDITETPRIHTSEQLVSAIISDCFEMNGMSCLKGKVLTYLDTVLGLKAEQARAFDDGNVDKVIYDRVSRVLATNEIRVELPRVIFGDVDVTYRADRGVDFEMSELPGMWENSMINDSVRITNSFFHSCSWIAEEEASLPCFTSFETENESFDANLRCTYRIESNESFNLI